MEKDLKKFEYRVIENKERIANRNFFILHKNLDILKNWLDKNPQFNCVLPSGGTTVLLRYNSNLSSVDYCKNLQKTTGVALLPGKTFEIEGYVRLGFCAENLQTALDKISEHQEICS